MTYDVIHDEAGHRFTATVDGHLAMAEYEPQGGVLRMTHTLVPDEIEGRGVAAALIHAAFEHAERQGLKVQPLCAYVRSYMERHPETQSLRA